MTHSHHLPTIAKISAALLLLATLGAAQPSHWQIGPFTRPTDGPVITPDKTAVFNDPIAKTPIHWEALHTFNPAAIVRDGKIVVLYRAEDDTGTMKIGEHTSRLGLATSDDGIHFTRLPEPVFYPAEDAQKSREWPGGVEDPRIVESDDGTYVLTYTQWNRTTYSIGIATSKDLRHWTKYGPAFLGAANGKYDALKYKSGGIVTRLAGDRLVAARINGKFGSGPNGYQAANLGKVQYIDGGAFAQPENISTVSGQPQYLIGNAPRNPAYGMRNPYAWNVDAGLRRSIPLFREGMEFTFEADCINVWNHVTFNSPNASWASNSTSFGTISGVSGNPGPRDWQFAGHITF